MNYDIGVKESVDGRHSVAWVCLECCEQGPPAPAADSLELAQEFAQISLRAHHAFFHRNAKSPSVPVISPDGDHSTCRFDWNGFEQRRAALTRAAQIFEKLCRAYDKVRSCAGDVKRHDASDKSFDAACTEWREAAGEFQDALQAYSVELQKTAEPIDAHGATSGQKTSEAKATTRAL